MKKRLTLDMAWTLCMKQWASMIRSSKRNPDADIADLKSAWVKRHGYKKVKGDCFFCEYGEQHFSVRGGCRNCPGRKINVDFDCSHEDYYYYDIPHAFYKKIKSLHKEYKKRLKAKEELK